MIFVTCKLLNGYKAYDLDSGRTVHLSENDLVNFINNKNCLNANIVQGNIEFLAGCSYALREDIQKYDCDTDKNFVVAEIYSFKKKKVVGYQVLKAYKDRFGTAWKSYKLSLREALEEHRVLQFVNVKCNGEKLYPKYGKLYRLDIDTGNVIPTKSKEVEVYKAGKQYENELEQEKQDVSTQNKQDAQEKLENKYIDKASECLEQYEDCNNKAMADYVDKKLKRKMNFKYTAAVVAGILLVGISASIGVKNIDTGNIQTTSPVTQIRNTVSQDVPKDDLSTVIRIETANSVEVSNSDILVDGIKVAKLNLRNSGYGVESNIESLYQKNLSGVSSSTVGNDMIVTAYYSDSFSLQRHIPTFGNLSYTIKAKSGKEYKTSLNNNELQIKDGNNTVFKASFDSNGNADIEKTTKVKTDITMLDAVSIIVQLYHDNNDFHNRLLDAE